jgi:hypothetical protein
VLRQRQLGPQSSVGLLLAKLWKLVLAQGPQARLQGKQQHDNNS